LGLGATPIRRAPVAHGAKLLVDLRSIGQWYTFYSGEADRFWIDLCVSLLDDDKLFLDIGANIGIYTVQVASAKRIAGQCHAFEPMPGNIARLRDNIGLNRLADTVTVHPFGLSDEPATLKLAFVDQRGEDTGNAEIVTEANGRETFDIQVRRLDEVSLPDRPIGVIKIDVEGHEEPAYRGGADRLARDRPFIIAEYNRMDLESRGLGVVPELGALPEGYVALRKVGANLERVTDWAALHRLENFLICPEEKIGRVIGLPVAEKR
jgi:FkbM family methyltransferase